MSDDILSDLYDQLERDPLNKFVQERLLEVWIELGDEGNDFSIAELKGR